jgi:predicted aspartyl protease
MRLLLATILLGLVAAAAISGCTHSGEAAGAAEAATRQSEAAVQADTLEQLHRSGDFPTFVAEAQVAAKQFANEARVRLLLAEALLASGDVQQAEAAALAAQRLAGPAADDVSSSAIRTWAAARLRQGLPLETAHLARTALDDSALQAVLTWSDLLAGAAPFRVESPSGESVTPDISAAESGSLAAELLAVDGHVNGTPCNRLFIDTGAQHTVITKAAAAAAGVRVQEGNIELAGFANATAQAGLIDSLRFGSLAIRNVPVLVGDTPALVAAGGSMSLGTDLLHHLRVTLDYPRQRVTIEPAGRDSTPLSPPARASGEWLIAVWTSSRLPLAQGLLSDGSPLRVLIDTGDRRGTYISYRWGRRAVPQLAGVHSGMVFRFKKKDLTLPPLELGGQLIVDWPVIDTLPKELDRLDVVDVMLGHDLLQRFRVTIDLARGEFRLAAEDPQTLAAPIRPARMKGEYDLP